MRILHTIASLDPAHGGPSRSVPALVSALRAQGVEVDLAVWDERRRAVAPERPPDVVHDHGLWLRSNHAAAVRSRRRGVPRIVAPRGMLEPWALRQSRLRKSVAWLLYQRRDLHTAAALHVTSEAEAESVRRRGLKQPLAVVPNTVDLPGTLPPRRRDGRRRALFLSRVHPGKGLISLVEAWAEVRPDGWELVIAGPDERGHRRTVEERVARAALEDDVRFTGPVTDDEKWALYRTAELFVLPTQSENFGIVVAEALAAGVPVITTRGAPWSALERERCGWWIDIGAEPLAAALQAAVGLEDAEREAMGARGREYVARELSPARAAADLCRVYEWLLRRTDPPACVRID